VPSRSASKSSSDTETSSEDMAPLVKRMRLVHSDGYMVDCLPLPGQ
jgi:hypothetical protein